MEHSDQPLLCTSYSTKNDSNRLTIAAKSAGSEKEEELGRINGVWDFFREFCGESRTLWYLAGPSIFTTIFQYTIGATTQIFAGQLGTLKLAAISVENSVIAGNTYGIMLGMSSGLETLCGQAYGAGQVEMLGIYMQRSWIILITASLALIFTFIFATPILKLLGQTTQISTAAGTFALWMIPQVFAYATMFPLSKFLQAQSKVMAMALIALAAAVLHVLFSWLLMLKLGWGLVGAAVMLNVSWWFISVSQFLYAIGGSCGNAWCGFSCRAFQNLWGFVKLSVASAFMFCLETWYTMALVLSAGYLKNAEVSVDALSICINLSGWPSMAALGFNVAASVRVSNELGSMHPRTARFSVVVAILTSFLIGLLFAFILIITRRQYPALFSNSDEVKLLVDELTPVLGLTIVLNNVQYVLSGVAIGAGWQALVAYINAGSYFLFGVPLSILMGYKLNMGVKGIWYGLVSGITLQTCLLFFMISRANWKKEANIVGSKLKQWGGDREDDENNVEGIY